MNADGVAGVIVNYRTKELTVDAARSLLAQPELTELVVVDNASGDDSVAHIAAMLPDPRLRVDAGSENLGFGRGVNAGVAGTSCPLVVVLNSDATLAPGSLRLMLGELTRSERTALVAPQVLTPDLVPQVDAFGSFPSLKTMLLRTNRHPRSEQSPDWVSGVAFLIRRSAFDDVGGFDPAFTMYLEDVDLCRRLRAAGWDIHRCPDATVIHLGGASAASDRATEERYHESLVRYLERAGYPRWQVSALRASHRGWQWARGVRRHSGRGASGQATRAHR